MVARKSYQMDVLFRIIGIEQTSNGNSIAILHGDEVRLIADADFSDLEPVRKDEQAMRKKRDESRMNESLGRSARIISRFGKNRNIMRQINISIRSTTFICPERYCIWTAMRPI